MQIRCYETVIPRFLKTLDHAQLPTSSWPAVENLHCACTHLRVSGFRAQRDGAEHGACHQYGRHILMHAGQRRAGMRRAGDTASNEARAQDTLLGGVLTMPCREGLARLERRYLESIDWGKV